MTNPALKKREEVITELEDAGFDARQSRGIVQAVVDTTASLDLATRADLRRAVAALNKRMDDIKEGLNKRIDDLRADMSALKASVDRLNRAIFWGLIIGLSILGILLG